MVVFIKRFKIYLILGLIVLIGALLRFNQLGTIAPSLTWDEVAWGYNAYSLGIDGRDEFGRFLPHDYLESFGDFKPPVYAYLDVLPVKFFGLTEFAVRFPSAFLGVLTVFIAYFLTKRIFYESQQKETYGLLASLFLAISPWHIMLSRAAFEANVASFFLICGIWFFLTAVQKKMWYLLLSALCFVIAVYTFNTARVVGPILILGLSIGFWRQLFKHKKEVILSAIFGLLLLLPTLLFLFSPQAALRYKEVNIFSDLDVISRTNQEITNDNNAWWSKIIHNRRFAYATEYVKHYLDNLSPAFLFIKGDGNPKFSTQQLGQLYVFELPFFIAGILYLFRKREKNWWIIPFWLLSGIIPAATARETPHALRIETTLPTFQIIVVYGMVQLFALVKKYKTSSKLLAKSFVPLVILYILFAGYNVAFYLSDYYSHYAKRYSQEWQYGYKDAVNFITTSEDGYSKVFLSPEMGRPYIYMLFYKQYDPKRFRQEAQVKRDPFGFVTVHSFNKYYFDKDILMKTNDKNILFVDSPNAVPASAKILKKFTSLDGTVVLVAYKI